MYESMIPLFSSLWRRSAQVRAERVGQCPRRRRPLYRYRRADAANEAIVARYGKTEGMAR